VAKSSLRAALPQDRLHHLASDAAALMVGMHIHLVDMQAISRNEAADITDRLAGLVEGRGAKSSFVQSPGSHSH